jgi:hypothetical protein
MLEIKWLRLKGGVMGKIGEFWRTRLGLKSRKAKLSLGQSAENKSLSAAPQTYAI